MPNVLASQPTSASAPLSPESMPRRVLLCVTGLSPQVVTETLYALCVQRSTPFIPTELFIVTTQEGAQRARLTLLDPDTGQFHALCRDYGLTRMIQFSEENILVINDAEGLPMLDMRTPQDNERAADMIMSEVRRLCADPQCAVHASIAGGRKTMGFYLGYAMSLFARPQDRLSHVLVSAPFEGLQDFYFPPLQAKVLYARDKRPVTTADAKIMLAEIPIVRLRDGLPQQLLKGDSTYSVTVAQAQCALDKPHLLIDFGARVVVCGGITVPMQPVWFAWYAWFAMLRTAEPTQQTGLRYSDAQCREFPSFLGKYLPDSGLQDRSQEALAREGLDKSYFEQKCSLVNKALTKALGSAAQPYKITAIGERPQTRHGLLLDVGHIELRNHGTPS